MSIKSYLFCCVFLSLLFTSCAPSFDLKKESANIIKSFEKLSSPEKRVDIFYPDSYNKDSIKNILKENSHIVNGIKKYTNKSDVKINTFSSTITIQNRLFRIVNVTETLTIPKKEIDIPMKDLKAYLQNNLYKYTEDATKLTATGDTDFIAIYHENAWEYFDFNVSIMYHAYGLKDTKKLVQLYYDEVFIPAEEKWEAESIRDFKEMYNESKGLPQYKDLDFDAYCDCMLQYYEKLDYDKDIPDGYFESETFLNNIYSCRILTKRE